MNMILGKLKDKLVSPFMLVRGTQADSCMWFPLFSICYFHHEKDSNIIRSKNQAHKMDGIAIGCCPISNAMLIHNPCNKQLYEPDS